MTRPGSQNSPTSVPNCVQSMPNAGTSTGPAAPGAWNSTPSAARSVKTAARKPSAPFTASPAAGTPRAAGRAGWHAGGTGAPAPTMRPRIAEHQQVILGPGRPGGMAGALDGNAGHGAPRSPAQPRQRMVVPAARHGPAERVPGADEGRPAVPLQPTSSASTAADRRPEPRHRPRRLIGGDAPAAGQARPDRQRARDAAKRMFGRVTARAAACP